MGFKIPLRRFSCLSSSGPCCLFVACFPAILCLTFPSLLFLSLRNDFPFLRCVLYLFSLLLPDWTAFDLLVSKSDGLCRHQLRSSPRDPQAITDPDMKGKGFRERFIFAFGKILLKSLLKRCPIPAAVWCWNSGIEALPDIWQFNYDQWPCLCFNLEVSDFILKFQNYLRLACWYFTVNWRKSCL